MDSNGIANWLSVIIAFLALILFIIAERDKFINFFRRNKDHSIKNEIPLSEDIRATIYTRILIGVIFGFAVDRVFYWFFLKYHHTDINQIIISFITAIILSLLFTSLFLRYSSRAVIFYVHLFERFAISFAFAYYLTLWYFGMYYEDLGYKLYSPSWGMIVLVGISLILLISFPRTPIDLILLFIYKNIQAKSITFKN